MDPFSPLLHDASPEARSLAAVLAINAQLAAELDPDRLVRAIVASGVAVSGAAYGGLFYREESLRSEGELLSVIEAREEDAERARSLPYCFGLPRPGHPLCLDDAAADAALGGAAREAGVGSLLSVAVSDPDGEALGALLFAHPDAHAFGAQSAQLAQAMAHQAAIALRNAWLHRRLAERERRHALVLGGLHDVVFQTTGDRVTYLNDAWAVHSQTPISDALGQPLASLFHDADAVQAALDRSRERVYEPAYLIRMRLRGSDTLFDLRWQHTYQEGERSLIGILTDVTDAVRLEAERAARQAAEQARAAADEARERIARTERLKAALLVNLNHEFRTPLSVIMGCADVLGAEAEDELKPFAADIRASGQRLLTTLTAILDLSRMEAGEVAAEPVYDSLSTCLRAASDEVLPAARARGLTLTVDVPDALDLLFDAALLRHAVRPVLDNALVFTERGGVVVRAKRQDRAVVVEVSDTGIGIPGDQVATLFEPFEQVSVEQARPHQGAGVGLALARHAAHLLGGRLSAQSEVGRGTTVRLVLPDAQPFPMPARQGAWSGQRQASRRA